MLMIRPYFCFIMVLYTCLIQLNVPLRLILITSSKSASFIPSTILSLVIPALFTRISILPYVATANFMSASASAKSATFALKATASPPAALISSTRLFARSSEPLKFTTTFAPYPANVFAISRPIPLPAPVTTATLSLSIQFLQFR